MRVDRKQNMNPQLATACIYTLSNRYTKNEIYHSPNFIKKKKTPVELIVY